MRKNLCCKGSRTTSADNKKVHLERTWKKGFCEMHVKNYFENLRPEEYNPEKVIDVQNGCKLLNTERKYTC